MTSKVGMRLLGFLLASLLPAASADAQAQEPGREPHANAPLNLPVSVEKIREALAQPARIEPLKAPADTDSPTFRVNISEQQKFEELLAGMKFETAGPQVAGGTDAYEQYRRLFPPIDNPLVQPYAAFAAGQAVTLGAEALIEKYVALNIAQAIAAAVREQTEREAREEVARSLAAVTGKQ